MSARKASPPKAAQGSQLGLFAAPPKPWDTTKAALLPPRVCLGCGVVIESGSGPLCEELCGPEDALYTWEERAGIAGEFAAAEQLGDRPPRPGR